MRVLEENCNAFAIRQHSASLLCRDCNLGKSNRDETIGAAWNNRHHASNDRMKSVKLNLMPKQPKTPISTAISVKCVVVKSETAHHTSPCLRSAGYLSST